MSARFLIPTLRLASRASIRAIRAPVSRNFQISAQRLNNSKLLRVLSEELEVVKTIDLKEGDKEINEFIEKTKFQLSQKENSAIVQLTKKHDDEIVRIFFDVEKVSNAAQQDQDFAEEETEEEELGTGFSNIYAVVEKNNSGLLFELTLQNFSDAFVISSITPLENALKYVNDFAEKGVYYDDVTYQGPEFMNLDESLQVEFETYLQERGFNEELLEFIVFASEHKEEGEYRKWLGSVTDFVSR